MNGATNVLRRLRKATANDRGTTAVTFILALPILLVVIGIITQYALLANAKLTLNRAAAAAARSAMTALPTDPRVDTAGADGKTPLYGVAYINTAACMVLESLSPRANDAPSDDALAVQNALQALMPNAGISDTYAARYTYAAAATAVTWTAIDGIGDASAVPLDFAQHRSRKIRLTVTYKFHLTVPLVRDFLRPSANWGNENIAGVSGEFYTLSSSYDVQLSPGREAQSDANGWPQ